MPRDWGRKAPGDLVEKLAGDRGGQDRVACCDGPDRGDDLVGGRLLEEKSACAGAQGVDGAALMNSSSYTCTSTPPDMSQPDTSDADIGVLYGGTGPSGS